MAHSQHDWHTPWRPYGYRSSSSSIHHHPHEPRFTHLQTKDLAKKLQAITGSQRLGRFLLTSSFAPLILRLIQMCFNAALVAIGTSMRKSESRAAALGVGGFSSVLAQIFASIGLVHACVLIYVEYYSSPISEKGKAAKVFYTLSDTVLVALFSALLALTFDNYFSSSLQCSSSGRWWTNVPLEPAYILSDPSRKGRLCHLQRVLIILVRSPMNVLHFLH